jgi:glycosyltransferase involved in cell wall biosynthesis
MAIYGGAELVVVKLAQYLIGCGHEVKVMTLSIDHHDEYEGLEFILPAEKDRVSYRLRGGLGSIIEILRMQLGLRELCTMYGNDYDVINAHNFPAIWAAPDDKRIVWMCNEVPDLWHNAKVNGLADKVFNIARYFDSKIVRTKNPVGVVADSRCAGIFRKRYRFEPEIIPYGIDGEFFSKYKNTPIDGQFRVICTSMISPSKNQLAILQAVKAAIPQIHNIKVVLSGYREPSHPYSVMIDRYIKENYIDVTYVGLSSREALRKVYSLSHVAVFTGKGQGSWLSPFEQLSMGIPIIVSPNLTCSDLIREQEIGVVTNNIEDALLNVYEHYSFHKKLALKGRDYVLRELTWDKYGEKMEKLLKEAVSK